MQREGRLVKNLKYVLGKMLSTFFIKAVKGGLEGCGDIGGSITSMDIDIGRDGFCATCAKESGTVHHADLSCRIDIILFHCSAILRVNFFRDLEGLGLRGRDHEGDYFSIPKTLYIFPSRRM